MAKRSNRGPWWLSAYCDGSGAPGPLVLFPDWYRLDGWGGDAPSLRLFVRPAFWTPEGLDSWHGSDRLEGFAFLAWFNGYNGAPHRWRSEGPGFDPDRLGVHVGGSDLERLRFVLSNVGRRLERIARVAGEAGLHEPGTWLPRLCSALGASGLVVPAGGERAALQRAGLAPSPGGGYGWSREAPGGVLLDPSSGGRYLEGVAERWAASLDAARAGASCAGS